MLGDAIARARRRRTVALATGVAGLGLVATVVIAILKRLVPTMPRLLVVVPGWAAILTFAVGLTLAVTSSARMQRSNLFYYNAVWRRWFGRWLFAVARLGLRRPRLSTSSAGSTLFADLTDFASGSDRALIEEAVALFPQLEERAADLLLRERQLNEAIADVGAPPALPTPLVAVPGRDQGIRGYAARAATDALLERRSSGFDQLRTAREEAAQGRMSLQLAADNLRIQLLRLRTRTGTISDLQHDLVAARGLLQTVP